MHRSVHPAGPAAPYQETGRRRAAASVLCVLILASTVCLASCTKSSREGAEEFPVIAVAVQAEAGLDACLSGSDCWLAAFAGMSFLAGDSVWASRGGDIFMLFSDGGRMAVARGSMLRMGLQGKAVRVELSRGEVWMDGVGPENSTVGTPAAALVPEPAKNAGWSMGVKVEPGGGTTVVVASGSALLENGEGSVTVTAGTQAVCEPGRPPGEPAVVEVAATSLSAPGFPYFVYLQVEPYFRNEATREKAEDDARERISAAPDDAFSHVNLARALLDAREFEGARSEFDRALALDPQLSQAAAGLGTLELLEGRWSEAGEAFSSARRADGQSLEAVFGMGQAALGRGDLREAEKWFKETLELDPEGSRPLTGLGTVELLRQDTAGALELLERAAASEPRRTRAYQVMALVYSLSGDLDRAAQYLVRALEVDPDDYRASASLGAAYLRLGRSALADAAFRRLVSSEEPALMADGYQDLGVQEELAGKTGPALDYWLKARDLSPGGLPVVVDCGQARLALEDNAASVADFSQAAGADPYFWYPHEWLARAYLAGGDDGQAIAESTTALALNPSAWISHVVLGLALEATGAQAEAASQIEQGRALEPPGERSSSEKDLIRESAPLKPSRET